MKKVHLTSLVLLFAGATFAQNVSTTTQNGDNNTTSVAQTGSNTVIIDQTQTGGAAQSGMEATVNQTGSGNTGDIVQNAVRQSRTTLTQSGTSNQAWVDQLDYANDVEINQNGTGNQATSFQDDGRFMLSKITQDGTGNIAETDQSKGSATGVTRAQAHITQTGGDNNNGYIRQDAYQRAYASIEQYSSDNDADIEQYSVVQLHTNHQAYITQQTGDVNDASIYQAG